jgi:polar amino acid transport system substrate-binding protein
MIYLKIMLMQTFIRLKNTGTVRALLYPVTRVLVVAVICASLSSCDKAAKSLTVSTGEWNPYSTQINNNVSSGVGGAYGIATDIVTAALREMNYEPRYEFYEWSVVENLIIRKQIIAAYPYVMAESRKDHFCYSDSIGEATEVLFYNIPGLGEKVHSIKGITDKTLGLVKGYEYDEKTVESFESTKEFETEKDAFSALVRGKIEVMPAEEMVGEYILSHNFGKERHLIGKVTDFRKIRTLHLVLPSKGPSGQMGRCDFRFLYDFNDALGRIKQKGIYDELTGRYRINTGKKFKVILVSTPRHPLIAGVKDRDDDVSDEQTPKVIIPHGTRAMVIQWSDRFTTAGTFTIENEMLNKTQVRLLEGPLKNRILWVPNVYISLKDK